MHESYKKIIVAVDGSKEAEWAFKKAVEIAKQNESSLVLSHIIDNRTFITIDAYDQSMFAKAEKFAHELLIDYKEYALNANIKDIQIDIRYGSPKSKIAKEIAPEYGADLIVCGATGMNTVERFFIGSVSEHITRYAKCDVLVVRTRLTK